jgi:hypothetical protein
VTDESDRFRKRAIECRRLSNDARNSLDRAQLEQMAEDLDDEADKIEAEAFPKLIQPE